MRMARGVLAHSLADTTRRGYRSAVSSLARFCEKYRLTLKFPVSADTLCLWMADRSRSLTYSSIRVYLHGIATSYVEMGLPSPIADCPIVWRMYKAVKRLQGSQAARKRLPITTAILDLLERHQDVSSTAGLAVRAVMWLNTCGLLRSGESAVRDRDSTVLRRSHLRFMSEAKEELRGNDICRAAYMVVHLARSKTDPFRAGTEVVVADTRAVSAMLAYLAAADDLRPDDPLFRSERGWALTVKELVAHTQRMLVAAGVADAHAYLGHSFRRGGATSLHLAGVPDSVIRIMGRWHSFAFARYIDTPLELLITAGRSMICTRGKRVAFAGEDFKPWA